MSNATFVRWQFNESRRCRTFPPLSTDHPSYSTPCVLCDIQLGVPNREVQLLAIGPTDADEKRKHDDGRWHTAAAVICHSLCVINRTDDELDQLVKELVYGDFAA